MALICLFFAFYLAVNAQETSCRTLFQRSRRWSPSGFRWVFPKISCGTRKGDPELGAGFEAFEDLGGGPRPLALQCPTCGSGLRILYGPDRFDGAGERLSSLIFYMALAAHSSYSFGGLIQMKLPFEPIPPLYVKVSSMLINGSFLIFTPPSFHSCIHGLEDLETSDLLAELPENQPMAVLTDLKRRFTGLPGRHWADLLTPEFLHHLRKAVTLEPPRHFKRGLNIALHVRRGDLSTHLGRDHLMRYESNEMYLQLAKQVLSVHPNATMHVFSTTGGEWSSKDFEVFKQQGFHVHLDGDDIEDWSHLSQADVLVMAKSTYSFTAGLFNSRCVVNFDHWAFPLRGWVQHDEGRFSSESLRALKSCVKRLR